MSLPDQPAPDAVAASAATGAVQTQPVPRKQVVSWALWDWATQPFNSVILTFVFVSLYLVSDSFLPADVAAQNADESLVCSRAADAATAGDIAYVVRVALERWEPRIDLEDVVVRFDDVDDAVLYIDVHYSIRGTNDPRNLVFPFYVIPDRTSERQS